MDKPLRRLGMALFLATLSVGLVALAQDPEPEISDETAELREDPVWPRVIED